MRNLFIVMVLMLYACGVQAQNFYLKTFGQSDHKPLIFLHGGPGGSAIDFEVTTALKLADKGFFVIVYDRRGEGRSADEKAEYNFPQTFADLNSIYEQYKLTSATLLGHSFGGIVGAKFASENPDKVKNLVLTGTPIVLQMSFKTILNKVKSIAEAKKDSATMEQLDFVSKQDTASIFYSSGSFMLAMQNGLYNTKNPDSSAAKYYAELMDHPEVKAYFETVSKNNYQSMMSSSMGFLNNEKYTSINLVSTLQSIDKVPVYGIYGKEDGLFDEKQINLIKNLSKEFTYLDNCSHNAFIDRQDEFINVLVKWLK